MKTLRLFVIAISAGLLLAGAGCNSTPGNEKTKIGEFDPNDSEALKVAKVFGDDILTGLKTDNYQLFFKNFAPASKDQLTEKAFNRRIKEMTERIGAIQAWTYLTVMNQAPFKVFVWKVSLQKEIKDKDNKLVKLDNERLFQLVIGKTDKGYVVIGFDFQ